MNRPANLYKRHRFPPTIIQYAVWLHHRFRLSHRDIEDLLTERGVEVSYESVRLWCNKFGPHFSRRLRRKHPGFGDTFFIDEVFVSIAGQRHLCSAITRSRRRGRRQIFVMQAVQHRSDAHAEALADSMAGWWCRGRHDFRWRIRHARTERHVWASVVVMTHP